MSAYLTTDELRALLDELGWRLHETGVHGRLLIVGGAAMSLGYDGRRVTRDLDAQYQPVGAIRGVAVDIAHAWGLRDNWLSSSAATFLPPLDPQDHVAFSEQPGLTVELASSRVLLAMKLAAFRATDIPDLVQLFRDLHLHDPDEAVLITGGLYGEHAVVIRDEDEDLRLRAEDILERLESDIR
ncbi:MAG: hypothetical protein ACRDQA_29050 [Nocardioidaceae bacterium]